MSWVVEQGENTSVVKVNGDTITCTKEGYYGSPVNVLYKDPANQNGQYYWQIDFPNLDKDSGSVSVGLTTEKHFQSGWGLKAMNYLGNLSDGSGLLVGSFGDRIKSDDKVGLLLQLTDADLKVYLFHNDRPLGLAFHIQSPYPKPLFPGKISQLNTYLFYKNLIVVSFSSNGTAKISRLQQIPTSLDRASLQFSGVEGDWKIVNYSQHPECVGCKFNISRDDENQNSYNLHAHVINGMNCGLEHNPTNNEWKAGPTMSTLMGGPPEEMEKESLIGSLISNIQNLEVQGQQHLIIKTNNGEEVKLERFTKAPPATVTQNIFN